MTKKQKVKATTPEKVDKKIDMPTKETVSSQASTWIAVAIALIVGLALGAGVMFSQNSDVTKDSIDNELASQKESDNRLESQPIPSEIMAEPPTETPTPSATPNETMAEPPTETPTPTTVGTTPTTVILVDQLSLNSFEYSLTVPSNSNVVKDSSSGSFEVKFNGGGILFVEQRYEAYEDEFTSYTALTGNLGTFYRVNDSSGYVSYVGSVQKVGSCSSMDGPIPAPCGLNAYSIASKSFLAAFVCDGASNTECDIVMKTVAITKL